MSEKSREMEPEEPLSLEKELEMDEEPLDTMYGDEIRSLQRESDIQRLSGRMTFLFIIIPTLLCAVFAFAYIDLRGRLKKTKSSGVEKVQALSEDVVGKVTTLLGQYKDLETGLGGRIAAIEKGLETSVGRLDREQKEIKKLSSSKADKKEVQAGVEGLTANLTELKEGLSAQKSSVETLTQKLEKELNEGANAVATFQSDLRMQAEQITKLSQTIERMQKKALELDLGIRSLLDDRETSNKELENIKGATITLKEKLNTLTGEMAWLQKRLRLTGKEKSETPGPPAVSQEESSVQSAPASGSEEIIEQDISH